MTTLGELVDLTGRVAVVTGGASGIGAAVVGQLRAAGATVEVADLDAHPQVDVADADSVEALATRVRERHGRCDVLVNGAGALAPGDVLTVTEDDWDRAFAVNVRGPWLLSRSLIPLMPAGSAIVNIGSGAGLRAIPAMTAYVASKSAVVGLTKAMAIDLADRGIRVNCVCPGLVDTPMARTAQAGRPTAVRDEVAGFASYLVPRFGTPDEVAAAVVFLASPASGYTTGSVLAVDGGRTLH
ncbi:SDR family NAD(P)-dependent oxidoreductase [Nocardioides sp. GXZ039]|uniref:SDR family NAD(P)-dependent oxidoreductase n=1 Tax=Nocardioides sp. GXZ039 TaxID=3136018 RepID=UPI0030F4AF4F